MLFSQTDGKWELAPNSKRRDDLLLWKSYSREQIPRLFGMEFSTAIWNVGYVARSGHICLLMTFDKRDHGKEFQYGDRFLSPTLFQWQSQNRTAPTNTDGQRLLRHRDEGVPMHLFVRETKKVKGGGAPPFVYCGDVEFVEWEGSQPITIRWALPEAVPARLRNALSVPGEGEDSSVQ